MTKDEFFELKARYDSLNLKLEFDEFDYIIKNDKDKVLIVLTEYKGKDKDIKIPEFIDIIGMGCFRNEMLDSVDLSNVFKIEESAFRNSTVLTVIGNNVLHIDEFAFQSSEIEEFIGENLLTIQYSAFESCKNLYKINLSNCGLIGRYAFLDCISLENIDLAHDVAIMAYGFKHTGIKELKLDTNYIRAHAFETCYNLTHVDLNCDILVDNAFLYCHDLKHIYVNSDVDIQSTNLSNGDLLSKIVYK